MILEELGFNNHDFVLYYRIDLMLLCFMECSCYVLKLMI